MITTFVGVGCGYCGSTALWHWLRQHPNVSLSVKKELHWFGQTNAKSKTNLHEYEHLFERNDHAVAQGEVTPHYFCDAFAADELKDLIPSAKIIMLLRDPKEVCMSSSLKAVRKHILRANATCDDLYTIQPCTNAGNRQRANYFPCRPDHLLLGAHIWLSRFWSNTLVVNHYDMIHQPMHTFHTLEKFLHLPHVNTRLLKLSHRFKGEKKKRWNQNTKWEEFAKTCYSNEIYHLQNLLGKNLQWDKGYKIRNRQYFTKYETERIFAK